MRILNNETFSTTTQRQNWKRQTVNTERRRGRETTVVDNDRKPWYRGLVFFSSMMEFGDQSMRNDVDQPARRENESKDDELISSQKTRKTQEND